MIGPVMIGPVQYFVLEVYIIDTGIQIKISLLTVAIRAGGDPGSGGCGQ